MSSLEFNQKELNQIKSNRWKVSWAFTITMLSMYFFFLILVSYHKDYLIQFQENGISLTIILGVSILFFTWIITGIYVWWANQVYDKKISDFKKKFI